MTMETLTLNNVTVEFPFKPYPCQVVYMEKVITALQSVSGILPPLTIQITLLTLFAEH